MRIGLLVLLAALIGFSLAGWQAPLIGASVLGPPLLFALYFRESGLHRDLPGHWQALTVGMALALGVGWGLIGGRYVSAATDVGLHANRPATYILVIGLVFPIAGAMLMIVPAMAVRALGADDREALDGFAVGSLGAVFFTAATTLTRLAPQLATGPWTDGQPLGPILAEAGIRGLVMPIVAAAVGGFVGIALWFDKDRTPRLAPAAIAAAIGAMVSIYAVLGLVETMRTPDAGQLVLHLLIAGLTLLVLRTAVQGALLRESHGGIAGEQPLLCAHCDHVVPSAPFCPSCGVATRAASRSSRTARRVVAPGQARPQLAYALPAGNYAATPAPRTKHGRVLLVTGLGLTIAAAAAFVVSLTITPKGQRYMCPPECGHPPMGVPVAAMPRFVARNEEFSVSYPGAGTSYKAQTDPNGLVLDYTAGDTGTMELFGQPAAGQTPRQIIDHLLKRSYPNAAVEYEIPNASVGYQPGYGVVADVYPTDPDSAYTHLRVVVLAAVKNDYALVASAIGPFHRFSPDYGSAHPSGANLELALDMGKYVNSFRWRGDPPR